MSKTLTAILIGAGNRGETYTSIMKQMDDLRKEWGVVYPMDK